MNIKFTEALLSKLASALHEVTGDARINDLLQRALIELETLNTTLNDVPEPDGYDDMLGEIRSGITGATSWDLAQIRDTGFIIGWVKNNSSDFFQLQTQPSHKRVLGSPIADFHIHALLDATAPTEGQTAVWIVSYIWISPNETMPALSGWTTTDAITQTFDGTEGAHKYHLFSFVTDIAAPDPDTYGSVFLAKVTRGNGTYTGKIGVLGSDCHILHGKFGSTYRYWD